MYKSIKIENDGKLVDLNNLSKNENGELVLDGIKSLKILVSGNASYDETKLEVLENNSDVRISLKDADGNDIFLILKSLNNILLTNNTDLPVFEVFAGTEKLASMTTIDDLEAAAAGGETLSSDQTGNPAGTVALGATDSADSGGNIIGFGRIGIGGSDDPTYAYDVSFIGDNSLVVTEDQGQNENGVLSGTLVASDPHYGILAFVPQSTTTAYGIFTIDAAGNWTYDLFEDNEEIQGLNDVESLLDTISIDVEGLVASFDFNITINGLNDKPEIEDISVNDIENGINDTSDDQYSDDSQANTSANVVVLFNSTFSGTSSSLGEEAFTVKETLISQGYNVDLLTDLDLVSFQTALSNADTFLLPENENTAYSSLSSDLKNEIINFVSNGGSLIINADYRSNDTNFLNELFGFSLVDGSTFDPTFNKTLAADGTVYENSPSSLPWEDGTYSVLKSSLPSNAISYYESDTGSGLFSIPFGSGEITFIAYDWYNAAPIGNQDGGWLDILSLTVDKFGTNTLYETSDKDDSNGTQDDLNNIYNGEITILDADIRDNNHTLHIVQKTENNVTKDDINIDSPTDSLGNPIITEENIINISLDSTISGGWEYNIEADFNELAVGEQATITFQYYADDNRGFSGDSEADDTTNEDSVSELKTITLTITGTNDKPEIIEGEKVVVSFDDVVLEYGSDDSVPYKILDNYEGLSWDDHVYVVKGSSYGSSGYEVGTTSGDQVALNGYAPQETTFTFDEVSTFNSMNLTSAWDSTQDVTLEGYLNGNLIYTSTSTINNLTSTFIELNWSEIDTLVLKNTGSHWAMDDFTYTSGNGNTFVISETLDSSDVPNPNADTLTTFSNTISGLDNDINDTHTISLVDRPASSGEETISISMESNLFNATVVLDVENTTKFTVSDLESLQIVFTETEDVDGKFSYDYTFSGNFNALSLGESATVTFSYIVSDNQGIGVTTSTNESSDSEVHTITLVITGTNDKPQITEVDVNEGGVIVYEELDGLNTNTFVGALDTVTDDDLNDTHTYELFETIDFPVSVDNTSVTLSGTPITIDPTTGTFSISGDFNGLALNEIATVSFYYTATDNRGIVSGDIENEQSQSEAQLVTVTITGTNDKPIVENVVILDELLETNGYETVYSGTLETLYDADVADSHTYGVLNVNEANDYGISLKLNGVEVTDQTLIDAMAIRVDNLDATAGTYDLAGNFDSLSKDDKLTIEFEYVSRDDSGAGNNESDPATVTLVVTGTNDKPLVEDVNINQTIPGTVESGNGTTQVLVQGEIVEIGSTNVSVDKWSFTHGGGALTLSIVTETMVGNLDNDGQVEALDTQIYLLASDGTVIAYNDDEDYSNNLFDSKITLADLPAGDYQVIVSAYDLTEQDILDGVNDITLEDYVGYGGTPDTWWYTGPYTLTFDSATPLSVIDDDVVIAETNGYETVYSGTLETLYDADVADSHTYGIYTNISATDNLANPIVISNLNVDLNPATGAYTVNGDFDSLGQGEKAELTFQYVSTDNSTAGNSESAPALVTLTVTGTNDLPVVIATTEVGGTTVNSAITSHLDQVADINATDKDTNDTLTYSIIPNAADDSQYLTIDTDGVVTFVDETSYNSSNSTALNFQVKVSDGNGGEVIYSIQSGAGIDGYIVGMTVFSDTTSNLVLDDGEASDTTNNTGDFTLSGSDLSGTIVGYGGTDVSTGLDFEGIYKAPSGSTLLNPITTLMVDLMSEGKTLEEAQALIKTNFGIDASVDLMTDPISKAVDATTTVEATNYIYTQTVNTQINNTIGQLSAALDGADITDERNASDIVSQELAKMMIVDDVDLTLDTDIDTLISNVLTRLGESLDSSITDDISDIIVNTNNSIETATSGSISAEDALESLAETQIAAEETEQELESGVVSGDTSTATSNSTGTEFTNRVNAAETGAVTKEQLQTTQSYSEDSLFTTSGAISVVTGLDSFNGVRIFPTTQEVALSYNNEDNVKVEIKVNITVNVDGTYNISAINGEDINQIPEDVSARVNLEYVKDGEAGTSKLFIEVNGQNDAPISSVVHSVAQNDNPTFAYEGQLVSEDIDTNDELTYDWDSSSVSMTFSMTGLSGLTPLMAMNNPLVESAALELKPVLLDFVNNGNLLGFLTLSPETIMASKAVASVLKDFYDLNPDLKEDAVSIKDFILLNKDSLIAQSTLTSEDIDLLEDVLSESNITALENLVDSIQLFLDANPGLEDLARNILADNIIDPIELASIDPVLLAQVDVLRVQVKSILDANEDILDLIDISTVVAKLDEISDIDPVNGEITITTSVNQVIAEAMIDVDENTGEYDITNPYFNQLPDSTSVEISFDYTAKDSENEVSNTSKASILITPQDVEDVDISIDGNGVLEVADNQDIDMLSLLGNLSSNIQASDIDSIDLTNGDHILSNLSTMDFEQMVADSSNELSIMGDNGDTLKLDLSTWSKDINDTDLDGNVDPTDDSFISYTAIGTTNQTLTLLIEKDITVEDI